jgi:hypothetical protein
MSEEKKVNYWDLAKECARKGDKAGMDAALHKLEAMATSEWQTTMFEQNQKECHFEFILFFTSEAEKSCRNQDYKEMDRLFNDAQKWYLDFKDVDKRYEIRDALETCLLYIAQREGIEKARDVIFSSSLYNETGEKGRVLMKIEEELKHHHPKRNTD